MNLKIKPEDLEALRQVVVPLDTPERRKAYQEGTFANAERCRDVNMRYRWDLLYATNIKIGDGVGVKGDIDLYAYLHDDHIDSALKRLIPDVVV